MHKGIPINLPRSDSTAKRKVKSRTDVPIGREGRDNGEPKQFRPTYNVDSR